MNKKPMYTRSYGAQNLLDKTNINIETKIFNLALY